MFERYQHGKDSSGTSFGRFARRFVAFASLSGAVLGFAYAAHGAKAHQPLTTQELAAIIQGMDLPPDFRIEPTDEVLSRINRVRTDAGRGADYKAAIERMEKLKPMISGYLAKYDMPQELLAVPMIESGYENNAQEAWQKRINRTHNVGAGLWMFVKTTARNYGLVVNDERDQRLDPELETDAAMRLLAANRLRFKDWLLSLAAYNQGETAVQKAIDQGHSRDAWKLAKLDLLNDYVATFSAAVILINNPQLID